MLYVHNFRVINLSLECKLRPYSRSGNTAFYIFSPAEMGAGYSQMCSIIRSSSQTYDTPIMVL